MTVWVALSLFVHVTVVPTLTVTALDWKPALVIDTALLVGATTVPAEGVLGEGGVCVALMCLAAVVVVDDFLPPNKLPRPV